MADSSVKELKIISTLDFLLDVLTEEEKLMISDAKCLQSRRFVKDNLSWEQLDIIRTGERDEVILAVIERMMKFDKCRFDKFDSFIPQREYRGNYIDIQRQWLIVEYHILGDPQDEDLLLSDSQKNHNPERYRAFYVIKYPERVEKGFKIDEIGKL
ncbi:MAG: hypothetical protein Q8L29_02805 [archaeon]|nr:hypothetical protein [archaeon]